jgi:hypothetical protein
LEAKKGDNGLHKRSYNLGSELFPFRQILKPDEVPLNKNQRFVHAQMFANC